MQNTKDKAGIVPRSPAASWQEQSYPESRFGNFTDIDGTLAFYARVHELLPPGGTALDIGCGRGTFAEDPVRMRRELRTLKRTAGRVLGIDVDPAAAVNPFVDEFKLIVSDSWPVSGETVDLAVADWVLEHVNDPERFFAEVFRVLKPGGYFCARTTNALSLMGLAAKLIPNALHALILQRTGHGRSAQDIFPTRYRCNTPGKLRAALKRGGFESVVYGYEGEPRYYNFSRVAYSLAVLYQRIAPRAFRSAVFAFAKKAEVT